ncbi:MAG: sulfur carrier protein ThiS [Actinobacteria bacterium]|nr:sulfur carrier protein ThiS [Actinomycetota bacterium]
MKIKVNDKIQKIEGSILLSDLLIRNGVKRPDMVAVQLNEEFVKKEEFTKIIIKENDRIDFLYYIGGGF